MHPQIQTQTRPDARYRSDLRAIVTINGVPPPVVLAGAQAIAAGGGHSMVLKMDDTVWVTGRNHVGQLGDGTTKDKHRFVQVFSGQ